MKRIIIIFLSLVIVFLIILAVAAVIFSFAVIKPTTEKINQKLVEKFDKVVHVPIGIQPPNYSFDQTSFFWEMETIEKEVTGIKFKYDTGFSKNQEKLKVVLEMPEGSDSSIFNKVLPAIITDNQSLSSVQDIEKANLSANEKTGYSQIKISTLPDSKQTTKVSWEFEKRNLGEDLSGLYSKLNYPKPLLKFLYGLPHLILSLLSA